MTESLLEVSALGAARAGVQVVYDFNLSVAPGESVAVLGPNGAGKSTSIDAICGQADRLSGSVHFDGQDITKAPTHQLARRGLVQVSQDRDLFPLLTVGENLELGKEAIGKRQDEATRLEDLLRVFPILEERWNQRAQSLSGGEQQMLAIARGLISGPKLLLLDEPSAGLAPAVVDSLIDLLREVVQTNLSLVLSEQNIDIALDVCDKFVVVRQGKTIFTGDRASLGSKPRKFIGDLYMGSAEAAQ